MLEHGKSGKGLTMAINVRQTQKNLKTAGYDPSGIDGIPGGGYYAALLAHNAQRQADNTIRAIGKVMAVQIQLYGFDNSPAVLAEWIAETAHETGGFKVFQENMCYSATRLMQVWPSRFKTLEQAKPYAWDPSDPDREDVELANYVYGSRMGNESNGTNDDDGWDHRGGGLLQHTGAAEYKCLKDRLGFEPDDVRNPAKAVIAACDFFTRAKTMSFAASDNFVGSRRSVNGGIIGLNEVALRRLRTLEVLV